MKTPQDMARSAADALEAGRYVPSLPELLRHMADELDKAGAMRSQAELGEAMK